MPFLSGEDRERYANPRKCSECKQQISNTYCSRCDEFYETGHKSTCSRAKQTGMTGQEHGTGTGMCGGDRGYR